MRVSATRKSEKECQAEETVQSSHGRSELSVFQGQKEDACGWGMVSRGSVENVGWGLIGCAVESEFYSEDNKNPLVEFLNLCPIDSWPRSFLVVGAVPSIAGCLAASLSSTQQLPVTFRLTMHCDSQKQIWPYVLWEDPFLEGDTTWSPEMAMLVSV